MNICCPQQNCHANQLVLQYPAREVVNSPTTLPEAMPRCPLKLHRNWTQIKMKRQEVKLRTLPISIIVVFSPSFQLQLTFVLQQTLTAATLYLQLTLRVRTAAQQTATRHRRDTQCGLTCPTLSRLTRPTINKAKRLRYPMQFTASSSSTVGSSS